MNHKLEIKKIHKESSDYFNSKKTLSYEFRIRMLRKLRKAIIKNEKEIVSALKLDLNKSAFEAYMSEYLLVINEIDDVLKRLKQWMKPERKSISLSQMPGNVKVYSEPFGVVLVMSPWNYPFQLTMIPVIGAMAAGNTVIIKPSAYSKHTSNIIEKIVEEAFSSPYIKVVKGGREENSSLLEQRFDYIFFTGSPSVGKIVMKAASKHLTPVTLELGGKSPCIVDKNVNIKETAKRIMFGKLINSGQTCVAPDYILAHKDIADKLIDSLIDWERKMLVDKEYFQNNFPKIINEKHYDRIIDLLKGQDILYRSNLSNQDQLPFTIIKNPDENSKLMTNEIFGPILPVITWEEDDEFISFIEKKEKPLALYLFTKRKKLKNRVIKELSYGGGCINDTIMHIAGHNHPFGGVGSSGMGMYHGKYSFDTFSNKKTVYSKWWLFDNPIRYHPYKNPNMKLPRFLLK